MKKISDQDFTDQLTRLYRPASPQLHTRIQAIPQNQPSEMPVNLRSQHPRRVRVASAAVAFAMLLIALFAASPAARAGLIEVIRDIGGMGFVETGDYPGGDGLVTEIPMLTMTLEEAQARFNWQISLPAWLPEGFGMQPEVRVMDHPDWQGQWVELSWGKPIEKTMPDEEVVSTRLILSLAIEHPAAGAPNGLIVGSGSLQEVQVNGEPAALVQGGWNYDTQSWGMSEIRTLQWEKDGLIYRLNTYGPEVSDEELIHIAESVP